jgi:hypothetical protein
MAETPQFEIDDGPPRSSRAPATPPPPEPAPDADDVALLREQIPAAQTLVAGAALQVQIANMAGLVLIFLCGQALGVLGRMDSWNAGVYLGLLSALGGMAAAAWLTLVTRHPGHELTQVPVPPVDPPQRKTAMSGTQMVAAHQRRRDEVALIFALARDFQARRRILMLSAAGALTGSVAGWIIGCGGHEGSIPLCATAGSVTGFAIGWRLAHSPGKGFFTDFTVLADPAALPWPHRLVERLIVGVMPGSALLMALIIGSPILWSLGLWIVTAFIAFVLRGHIVAYGVKAGLQVAAKEDDAGAFIDEHDDLDDDDGEEDADAEADEEDIDSADDDDDGGGGDQRPATASTKR